MSRGERAVNRTRGFVNLNRFKWGKGIKKLTKIAGDKQMAKGEGRKRRGKR